jgi:predicted unusual protein kinase regulating ubiquinone biosynthesis (AarF/ABC1/UbiB family)
LARRQGATRRALTIVRRLALPLLHYSRAQRRFLSGFDEPPAESDVRHAQQLVESAIALGPTFIKFGQILSTRPDIMPEAYTQALSTLQDEVPPAPFDEVKRAIEQDIGSVETVFSRFDEKPIASASLSQVYRAVLDGQDVVVKVRRPHIEEVVATDILVLRRLLPFMRTSMEPFLVSQFEVMLATFSHTIFDEMNFRIEANSQVRIKENLRDRKDVIVPSVLTKYVTDRVLVMQYVPGIKITDLRALDSAGIDRRDLAKRLNRLYLEMAVETDIFQADPHPGNISVKGDGTIVLYDYGMVGSLSEENKRKVLALYHALILRDTDMTISKMKDLGLINPKAQPALLRAGVERSFRAWEGKGIDVTNLNEIIHITNAVLQSYPVRLTPEIAQLIKASQMLEGVCINLDPHFSLIANLMDFESRSGRLEEAIAEDIDNALDEYWKALLRLPRLVNDMHQFFREEDEMLGLALSPPGILRGGLAFVIILGTGLATWGFLTTGFTLLAILTTALGSASTALILFRWKTRSRRAIRL